MQPIQQFLMEQSQRQGYPPGFVAVMGVRASITRIMQPNDEVVVKRFLNRFMQHQVGSLRQFDAKPVTAVQHFATGGLYV